MKLRALRGIARPLAAGIPMVVAGAIAMYAVAAGSASRLAATFSHAESQRHARAIEFEGSAARGAVSFCFHANGPCAARPLS